MLRIERLSPDAQRARAGDRGRPRLDEPTLADVTGIDHDAAPRGAARGGRRAGAGRRPRRDGFAFRHALLREALYDDLLPGERVELHLALARRSSTRRAPASGERRARGRRSPATTPPPATSRRRCARRSGRRRRGARRSSPTARPPTSPSARSSCGRACPTGEALSTSTTSICCVLAAGAHGDRRRPGARARCCCESALGSSTPSAIRAATPSVLARLPRTQWMLNRGARRRRDRRSARCDLLPGDEAGPERAHAARRGWRARASCAATSATRRRRREGARARRAGRRHRRRGRGAQHARDGPDGARRRGGAASLRLRRAIEIAREIDDLDGARLRLRQPGRHARLAGRTREAMRDAQEGLADDAAPLRAQPRLDEADGLRAGVRVPATGRRAREYLGRRRRRRCGVLLIFRRCARPSWRWARATRSRAERPAERDRAARRALDRAAVDRAARIAARASCAAAGGELVAARARGRGRALDRIELCTDDVMRIARVTAVGARVEADFAQRARDLREQREARDALARARIHVRAPGGGRAGRRPGRARPGTDRRRPSWRGPAGATTPKRGRRRRTRGRRSSGRTRRRSRAGARPRRYVERGRPRGGGDDGARLALERAERLGSRWLAGRGRGRCSTGRGWCPAAAASDGAPAATNGAGADGVPKRIRSG